MSAAWTAVRRAIAPIAVDPARATSPGARAMVAQVVARFAAATDPGPGTIALDGAALALWDDAHAALLAWIRATGGLARCVEVVLAALGWRAIGGETRGAPFALATVRAPAPALARTRPWTWLRAELARAPYAERERALEIIHARADGRGVPWCVRAALASLVPGEPGLYTDADERAARDADVDEPAHAWFATLAALGPAAPPPRGDLRVPDLDLVISRAQIAAALGARAVVPLRLARAYPELAALGHRVPDAWSALFEFADGDVAALQRGEGDTAGVTPWEAITALPITAEAVAAAHAALARAPAAAAALVEAWLREAAVVLAGDATRAPDLGWVSPWSRADAPPGRRPKLPAFVALDRLPRPITASGEALAGDGLATFVAALKATLPDGHACLDDAAARYTPESLAACAWSLFRMWLFGHAPPKDKWAMQAIGRFGGVAEARALGALARAWAPSGNSARAQEAVETLARMRRREALIEISDIARTAGSPAFANRARAALARVADELGVGLDELEDQLIPPIADAELAFGDAIAQISPGDPALEPKLPAAIVAALEPADRERLAALADTCRQIARGQRARLELAMADATRLGYRAFAETYLMHPVMRALARGLVWIARDPRTGPLAFALADDGSPIDVDGGAVVIDPASTIEVAHPAELGADACATWRRRLAARQPFPQLDREVYGAAGDGAAACARRLAGYVGREVATAALRGLARRGWQRGQLVDGYLVAYQREGRYEDRPWSIVLAFLPGIHPGAPMAEPRQRIDSIALRAVGDPPRAVLSELERDIAGL